MTDMLLRHHVVEEVCHLLHVFDNLPSSPNKKGMLTKPVSGFLGHLRNTLTIAFLPVMARHCSGVSNMSPSYIL